MIDHNKYYYPPTNIELAQLFNVAKDADEQFFDVDIIPCEQEDTPRIIRIYVTLSISSILTLTRTLGTDTVTEKLNGGSPLTAGCAHIFDIAASCGESINFTASTDTTVNKLSVFWVI